MNNDSIKVYPTIVENDLFIQTSLVDYEIRLYSISGQLMNTYKPTEKLDLQFLEAGLYFVEILEGNTTKTIKIIKN